MCGGNAEYSVCSFEERWGGGEQATGVGFMF